MEPQFRGQFVCNLCGASLLRNGTRELLERVFLWGWVSAMKNRQEKIRIAAFAALFFIAPTVGLVWTVGIDKISFSDVGIVGVIAYVFSLSSLAFYMAGHMSRLVQETKDRDTGR
jgi:hypothetical protein